MSRRPLPPHAARQNLLSGLGRAISGAPGLLLHWSDRSRSRHALGGLEDRLLKDIGVSRAEADEEARKPFWRR